MPRPSTPPDARKLGTNLNPAVLDWFNQRKEALTDKVSAHDVLRHFGVKLKFGGSDREEQIQCPFHNDSNPSAKVYPANGRRPSHLYCFACRGHGWDIFDLWKLFQGNSEMKFTQVLRGLEEAFGLEASDPPYRVGDFDFDQAPRGPSEEDLEVQRLLDVCERRLRDSKSSFKLAGFLVVGQCLDRLHYRIEKGLLKATEAKTIARKILDKIGEKVRVSSA
jgi:hypothetical protein